MREPKDLLEAKAAVMDALASPVRIRVVEVIGSGEMCLSEIAEKLKVERTLLSRHLSRMERAGVLVSRKKGRKVLFRLGVPCVLSFLECAGEVVRARLERLNAVVGDEG